MTEETKTVEQSKQGIKDAFYEQLNKASIDLIKKVINARSLGIAIAFWFLFSVGASLFRRFDTVTMPDGSVKSRCDVTVPLDTYFMAKMVCPIKE